MTNLISEGKKILVALAVAAGAVAYDIPTSGHVNDRAVILLGIKTFLGALGITVAAMSEPVKTAVAAVAKKN